jgi:hypothetical protein
MLKRTRASVLLLVTMACSSNNGTPATPPSPTPPSPPTPSVSAVTVSGATPTVGVTAPFSATANLSNGTAQAITSQATWRTSNTSVASVTNGGAVTGVGIGEADITASYQGVSGTAHISVVRAMYTVSGLVTDGTSGGILPNIYIQTVDTTGTGRSTRTDSAGNYSTSGVAPGPLTLTASAVSYQTTMRTVTVSSDTRIDIVLERAPISYAGIWTGQYQITDCRDFGGASSSTGLCTIMARTNAYRFTLSQNGTTVAGSYALTSALFDCPCGGQYGGFAMSGSIAPGGELLISATGSPTATHVDVEMTFSLEQTSPSTLTGTVSGVVRLDADRWSTFNGIMLSGTR